MSETKPPSYKVLIVSAFRLSLMTRPLALLALCFTGAAVAAKAVPAPAPAQADANTKVAEPALQPLASSDAQAQFHVLAGEMAAGRQQPAVAAAEFLEALKVIDDADLAQRATALAVVARDEDLAKRAAQRWLELDSTSMDAREILARIALSHGDLVEVIEQCREIIDGHAGGTSEGFRHVALILGQIDDRLAEPALEVMKQLILPWPELSGAYQAMGMLALRFGQLPIAEQAAGRARELAPKDREPALLLVGVYAKQGRLEEADKLMNQLLRDDKNPAELRLGYAKLLLESEQRDAARKQLLKALEQKPDLADARFALGVLAFNDRDYKASEAYFKPLLKTPRAQDATYELGRIAEAQRNYPAALDYYAQVTRGVQSLDAAVRRASVLARQDRLPEARELLASLREQLPQLAERFYLAEGDLLLGADELDAAQKLYSEALSEFPQDPDLIYGRSLVYERQKKLDLAEKDLRTLLNESPDDTRALNALGYMLVVHTNRYDEAHELIGKALAQEPEDPAIIDSMGWVQFKRGNTEDARDLLRKAFARFPDPEVAAHLGEVLWTLGSQDEARTIWDKALRDNPGHPTLTETVDRLTR